VTPRSNTNCHKEMAPIISEAFSISLFPQTYFSI